MALTESVGYVPPLGVEVLNVKVLKFISLIKGLRRSCARDPFIPLDECDAGDVTLGVDKIYSAPRPVREAKCGQRHGTVATWSQYRR